MWIFETCILICEKMRKSKNTQTDRWGPRSTGPAHKWNKNRGRRFTSDSSPSATRLPPSSAIAAGELSPVNPRFRFNHPSTRLDERNTTEMTLPLASSLSLSSGWSAPSSTAVSLTHGPVDPRGPAVSQGFEFFFIYFSRFCCKLQKFITGARNVQIEWNKFCWVYNEVYYLKKYMKPTVWSSFMCELNEASKVLLN